MRAIPLVQGPHKVCGGWGGGRRPCFVRWPSPSPAQTHRGPARLLSATAISDHVMRAGAPSVGGVGVGGGGGGGEGTPLPPSRSSLAGAENSRGRARREKAGRDNFCRPLLNYRSLFNCLPNSPRCLFISFSSPRYDLARVYWPRCSETMHLCSAGSGGGGRGGRKGRGGG